MIKELLYKWFGLEPLPCATCEVLRAQLEESNRERRELLHTLLNKDKVEESGTPKIELQPIMPQHIPWRIRQLILETEDRKRAQLMRDKEREIADTKSIEKLEKELGVKEDAS